jgi:hypothetical protein
MIKSRRMRWAEHIACIGGMKNAYDIFVVRSEGKRPLGRPRLRWDDDNKRDLREIGWEGVDWIHLGQVRDRWWIFVNTVMNLRVP